MRYWRPTTLATSGPAAKARHLGRDSGLIDEDQVLGIKARRGMEPRAALGCDVGGLLLSGVCCFLKLVSCRSSKRHSVLGTNDAP
jgi:hypothetical protein